jgi:hypothetical protein
VTPRERGVTSREDEEECLAPVLKRGVNEKPS